MPSAARRASFGTAGPAPEVSRPRALGAAAPPAHPAHRPVRRPGEPQPVITAAGSPTSPWRPFLPVTINSSLSLLIFTLWAETPRTEDRRGGGSGAPTAIPWLFTVRPLPRPVRRPRHRRHVRGSQRPSEPPATAAASSCTFLVQKKKTVFVSEQMEIWPREVWGITISCTVFLCVFAHVFCGAPDSCRGGLLSVRTTVPLPPAPGRSQVGRASTRGLNTTSVPRTADVLRSPGFSQMN